MRNKEANTLFSICMPTYNRVETLRETLPDLIDKIQNNRIKIFISDNNSTDGTEDYIGELKKIYPHIVYIKSSINKGADRNMRDVLNLSDTKYRFLLSDHYILCDHFSVDKILNYLDSSIEYDALVLHYKNSTTFKDIDFLYTNINNFLEEFGWYIGMAATTIYHEKMVKNLNFDKYFDTNFVQSLTLLDYISNRNFKIQFIADDIVWNSKGGVKGSHSWHHQVLEIFTKNWVNGIMSLPNEYSLQSKRHCIKNHAAITKFYSFKNLVLFRYTEGFTLTKIIKHVKYFYYCADLKTIFFALLLSIIPIRYIKNYFRNEYEYIQRVLGNIDMYKKDLGE